MNVHSLYEGGEPREEAPVFRVISPDRPAPPSIRSSMTNPERPAAGIETLPDAERLVLEAICELGEADAYTLSVRSFTSMASCRQLLRRLRSRGLIESRSKQGQTGRPLALYHLTEGGRSLFPRGHLFMLLAVLDSLKARSPAAYDEVFETLPRWFILAAEPKSPRDQLTAFAERCEQTLEGIRRFGHLISLEPQPDGSAEFLVHHCAVLEAAQSHPGLCSAEIAWWRSQFSDCEVSCFERQAEGAAICRFKVQPPAEARLAAG